MKKEKIGFVSLGCPKNLTDTEVMLSRLVEAGYEITPEETEADVIIINTCGFIESAKTEAIDNILYTADTLNVDQVLMPVNGYSDHNALYAKFTAK